MGEFFRIHVELMALLLVSVVLSLGQSVSSFDDLLYDCVNAIECFELHLGFLGVLTVRLEKTQLCDRRLKRVRRLPIGLHVHYWTDGILTATLS